MTPIASIPAVSPTKVGMKQSTRSMRRMGPAFGLMADPVVVSKQNAYGQKPAYPQSVSALTNQQVKAFFVPGLQAAQPSAVAHATTYKVPKYSYRQFSAVEEYEKNQNIPQNRLAAQRSRWLMNEVVRQVRPGMTESQAQGVANRVFLAHPEVEAIWHKPIFRFGPNTQMPPTQQIKQEHVLQPNDIFSVEIAPVFTVEDKGRKMLESSAGETFLMRNGKVVSLEAAGPVNDPQKRVMQASRAVFNEALDYWRKENPTGLELMEFVKRRAQDRGYLSAMEPSGHITGLFPHEGWPHGLNTYPYTPNEAIWMLEVQLRDPMGPYGAYHKGLLK